MPDGNQQGVPVDLQPPAATAAGRDDCSVYTCFFFVFFRFVVRSGDLLQRILPHDAGDQDELGAAGEGGRGPRGARERVVSPLFQ